MVSICDDLRRLDKLLLILSKGSARNLQNYALLCSARRHVQALEKKARALHLLHGGYWRLSAPSNSSGGAAPLCDANTFYPAQSLYSTPHSKKEKQDFSLFEHQPQPIYEQAKKPQERFYVQ